MITTMTYNVANGLADPAVLVALLRGTRADIVGLQELAVGQAAAITRQLADAYPYQALHPLGIPGKGLLSRHPIEDAELLHLYPDRPDLRATVLVDGFALTVIVAHPPPPRFGRAGLAIDAPTRVQIEGLIQAATAGGPAVLMGDFNMTERDPLHRQIAGAGLTDAFRAAGRGAGVTLPTRMARWAAGGSRWGSLPLPPLFRVDYVWLTPDLTPLDAWVGEHAGSDHLPVYVRLAPAGLDRGESAAATPAAKRRTKSRMPARPRLAADLAEHDEPPRRR